MYLWCTDVKKEIVFKVIILIFKLAVHLFLCILAFKAFWLWEVPYVKRCETEPEKSWLLHLSSINSISKLLAGVRKQHVVTDWVNLKLIALCFFTRNSVCCWQTQLMWQCFCPCCNDSEIPLWVFLSLQKSQNISV